MNEFTKSKLWVGGKSAPMCIHRDTFLVHNRLQGTVLMEYTVSFVSVMYFPFTSIQLYKNAKTFARRTCLRSPHDISKRYYTDFDEATQISFSKGFTSVVWIIFLMYKLSTLEFKVTDWWRDVILHDCLEKIISIRSCGCEAVTQLQTSHYQHF